MCHVYYLFFILESEDNYPSYGVFTMTIQQCAYIVLAATCVGSNQGKETGNIGEVCTISLADNKRYHGVITNLNCTVVFFGKPIQWDRREMYCLHTVYIIYILHTWGLLGFNV